MSLTFERFGIRDVFLITPKKFEDSRGLFVELYKSSEFNRAGITEPFLQDNYSRSVKHVLRGLHYQIHPKAQGKLVRCIRGSIFDVCVDIRRSSSTYGKWVGKELTDLSNQMIFVPPGFAHGFLALTDVAEVVYKCTEEYSPECERGIIWNDGELNIEWPVSQPSLSEKDRRYPAFRNAEINFP